MRNIGFEKLVHMLTQKLHSSISVQSAIGISTRGAPHMDVKIYCTLIYISYFKKQQKSPSNDRRIHEDVLKIKIMRQAIVTGRNPSSKILLITMKSKKHSRN